MDIQVHLFSLSSPLSSAIQLMCSLENENKTLGSLVSFQMFGLLVMVLHFLTQCRLPLMSCHCDTSLEFIFFKHCNDVGNQRTRVIQPIWLINLHYCVTDKLLNQSKKKGKKIRGKMAWTSSAQLSSCQRESLRCLFLCRNVGNRGIPNAAVTGRKGVRIPQGTCSSSGNEQAVVWLWTCPMRTEFPFSIFSSVIFPSNRSVVHYLQHIWKKHRIPGAE